MSFFKRLLGMGKSKEQLAEEYLLDYKFGNAVDLHTLDSPVSPDILIEVVDEMCMHGKLDGRLVGKKGWYLPNAKKKLGDLLKNIKREPLEIEDVSKATGLNKSRSVIAIKDHIKRTQQLSGLIFEKKEKVVSPNYIKDQWKTILNSFDFVEEQIPISEVYEKLPDKELFLPIVEEYLKDPKSPVVKNKDGIVLLREMVDELLGEKVKNMWEEGAQEITFEEIADEFGVTNEEASKTILRLVNDGELHDVTVYTADELIKRRSSH